MKKQSLLIVLGAALSLSLFGCGSEGSEGEGEGENYENNVRLECNGDVLVDETFTSREACEDFRDDNSFSCAGVDLSINC